eukprot:GHVS01035796.1.p1 GENE.GHVS01035796.1~~GHVS01035796.1.p1  ORF type:complete len:141 (+),score=14.94 GHVS01035796.1:79-501(+)
MRVSGKLAWMLFVLLVVVLEVSDRAVASGQTFRSLMKKSSSGGGNSSSGLGQSSETVLGSAPTVEYAQRVCSTVCSKCGYYCGVCSLRKMPANMSEKLPAVATVENVSTSRYCGACHSCLGPDLEREKSGMPASMIDGGT